MNIGLDDKTLVQTSVVYDDDEIQVLWHPGESSYVLITFGDLGSKANGEKFFADTPVKKLKMTCIGVMPKSPNWFPRVSMVAASQVINSLSSTYKSRVLYGGSMGGYAAIKFSKLLKATDVISLCPQFSIADGECEPSKNGWKKYYRPITMEGMRISSEDISGNVNVFYDPQDEMDQYHFSKIKQENSKVKGHAVPLVGHHVTTAFAGTSNLAELVNATMQEDNKTLAEFIRNRRQYHRWRIEKLIRKAAKLRPSDAWTLFSKIHNLNPDIMQYANFQEASFLMSCSKDHLTDDQKMRIFLSIIRNSKSPTDMLLSVIQLEDMRSAKLEIVTDHKSLWFYDPTVDQVVHSLDSRGLLALNYEINGDEVEIFIKSGSVRIGLHSGPDGTISTKSSLTENTTRIFKISSNKSGVFSLSDGKKFLCAEKNGRLVFNRPSAGGWEQFRFVVHAKSLDT